MHKYNGANDQKAYVAVKGEIYDVSSSPFYKPGQAYHVFTGHDASINLAKMTHDEQLLDKYGEIQLDNEEDTALNEWKVRFEQKYPKIGKIVKWLVQNLDWINSYRTINKQKW